MGGADLRGLSKSHRQIGETHVNCRKQSIPGVLAPDLGRADPGLGRERRGALLWAYWPCHLRLGPGEPPVSVPVAGRGAGALLAAQSGVYRLYRAFKPALRHRPVDLPLGEGRVGWEPRVPLRHRHGRSFLALPGTSGDGDDAGAPRLLEQPLRPHRCGGGVRPLHHRQCQSLSAAGGGRAGGPLSASLSHLHRWGAGGEHLHPPVPALLRFPCYRHFAGAAGGERHQERGRSAPGGSSGGGRPGGGLPLRLLPELCGCGDRGLPAGPDPQLRHAGADLLLLR